MCSEAFKINFADLQQLHLSKCHTDWGKEDMTKYMQDVKHFMELGCLILNKGYYLRQMKVHMGKTVSS